MSRRRGRVASIAALLVLLGAPAAVAQTPPPKPAASGDATDPRSEARERFERGIDLFQQGDHTGALAEFRRSYELSPVPVVLYNTGLVYVALGRPVEAADAMSRVLAAPGSLAAERIERARATLREQSARIGELSIASNVDGAAVDVDGVEVAKTPLASPLRVKGGPHRVGAVKAGHAPSRKEVVVPAGGRAEVSLSLEPTDKTLAHVTVQTKLPGAEVAIDGQVVGTTPVPASIAVLPGRRRVEVRRAGYATAWREIDLGDGSSADIALEPEEDANAIRAAGATLSLDVSESGVVVLVDGKLRGEYRGSLPLAPGPHRVRVERVGFFPYERDVTVDPQRPGVVQVVLQPTPETRTAFASSASSRRFWGWIGVAGGAAVGAASVLFLVINGARTHVHDDELARGGQCFDGDGSLAKHEKQCNEWAIEESHARARQPVGFVTLGIGAAALGVGAYLLLTGEDPTKYDRKPTPDALAMRLWPRVEIEPRAGALGVGGMF